jgi:hypothetical protein
MARVYRPFEQEARAELPAALTIAPERLAIVVEE